MLDDQFAYLQWKLYETKTENKKFRALENIISLIYLTRLFHILKTSQFIEVIITSPISS